MTYKKSQAEVEAAFVSQVKALGSSCDAFDHGELWEAARIAAAIHILLYDSGKSQSVLTQLNKKGLPFVCTAGPVNPANMVPSHPLVMITMGPDGVSYQAPLADGPEAPREFKFKRWWRGAVFAAPQSKWTLSRQELISNVRNQDGGGHFDEGLTNEKYVEFSRSPQWMVGMADGGKQGLMGLELHTVRQIGWEVMETFKRGGLI